MPSPGPDQEPPIHSPQQEKRCKLLQQWSPPFTEEFDFCIYQCRDWRGDTVRRRIKRGFPCPKELDWWQKEEIPGAVD